MQFGSTLILSTGHHRRQGSSERPGARERLWHGGGQEPMVRDCQGSAACVPSCQLFGGRFFCSAQNPTAVPAGSSVPLDRSWALLQWWQFCGCRRIHMGYAEHVHKGRCWDDQWFGLGNSWANSFSRDVGPMGHGTELWFWQRHRASCPLTCPIPSCVCTNCTFGKRSSPIPFCITWKIILLVGIKFAAWWFRLIVL